MKKEGYLLEFDLFKRDRKFREMLFKKFESWFFLKINVDRLCVEEWT